MSGARAHSAEYAWKFLRYHGTTITSNWDGSPWTVGEWREVAAPGKECIGLNASDHAVDAFDYVGGERVALVEYAGKVLRDDKLTCQKMRLVAVWTREDFERIQQPAWEEYRRIRQSAWEEYKRIVDAGLLATTPTLGAVPDAMLPNPCTEPPGTDEIIRDIEAREGR